MSCRYKFTYLANKVTGQKHIILFTYELLGFAGFSELPQYVCVYVRNCVCLVLTGDRKMCAIKLDLHMKADENRA